MDLHEEIKSTRKGYYVGKYKNIINIFLFLIDVKHNYLKQLL